MTKRKREDEQRFGCIYMLTNLITLLCYVGKTIDFKRRMRYHKNSKKNYYLSRSIQKHGWHNFKVEIPSMLPNTPGIEFGTEKLLVLITGFVNDLSRIQQHLLRRTLKLNW